MDFEFSPDALMLRDMLRRFVEKDAKPLERKFFTTGALEMKEQVHLRKVIEQMGLWGATVPEQFGGGGLDMETVCLIEEELGKTFIPVELGEVPPLLFACQGEQVEQFLQPALEGSRRALLATREPPVLGRSSPALTGGVLRPEEWTTTATPNGDTFILSGKKLIAIAPSPEDFLVVFAKAPAGITVFLLDVDQKGLKVEVTAVPCRNDQIILWLEDCCIDNGSVLGECGKAFSLGVEEVPRSWIRIGARLVGLAERLVEMAAAYANDWVALGTALPVTLTGKDRPAVQRMLAEMQVQIEGARWVVYHAAWQADRCRRDGPSRLHLPSAKVRLVTGEMLCKVVDQVTMIFGGPGGYPGMDVPRIVKSVLPEDAFELALESARVIIAKEILSANLGS